MLVYVQLRKKCLPKIRPRSDYFFKSVVIATRFLQEIALHPVWGHVKMFGFLFKRNKNVEKGSSSKEGRRCKELINLNLSSNSSSADQLLPPQSWESTSGGNSGSSVNSVSVSTTSLSPSNKDSSSGFVSDHCSSLMDGCEIKAAPPTPVGDSFTGNETNLAETGQEEEPIQFIDESIPCAKETPTTPPMGRDDDFRFSSDDLEWAPNLFSFPIY